jgi:hypothetical protein
MAIRFPENCTKATAGQIRNINSQGYSDSGIFSSEYVQYFLMNPSNFKLFLKKTEPVGVFMTALNEAQKEIFDVTSAITVAANTMVSTASKSTESMTESSRKMRDATEKLGSAISKFNGIANGADLAKIAENAERLAESLERLAMLQSQGKLEKIISAIK